MNPIEKIKSLVKSAMKSETQEELDVTGTVTARVYDEDGNLKEEVQEDITGGENTL